jgi:nitrate/TMAO reductase-like tetraheme cytochrome c subunit
MRLFKLVLILFIISMPVAASAEKAKTIDELAKMLDSSSCKACHAQIYEEWDKSMHARSLFGTKRTLGGYKGMIEAGLMKAWTKSGVKSADDLKVEHFAQCFKCHLPVTHMMTDAVAKELGKAFIAADAATIQKLGISCIVCHNTKAIVHKWQDGEPEPTVLYGTKDVPNHPDAVYKAVKKSAIMTEAVACGQCHGTGPNLEFPQPSQCATAYGSYLHSYIPAGGSKVCQDCHMKDSKKGHQMPAYRDPDMQKMAVDVNVDITPYKFLLKAGDHYPMAVTTVRITNKAGHRIPDG